MTQGRGQADKISDLEAGIADILARWAASDLLPSEGARIIVRWFERRQSGVDKPSLACELLPDMDAGDADILYFDDAILRKQY